MTEPEDPAAPPATDATTPGAPVDDRRADPPPPASATVAEGHAPATEAERQTVQTVQSISRLEESN